MKITLFLKRSFFMLTLYICLTPFKRDFTKLSLRSLFFSNNPVSVSGICVESHTQRSDMVARVITEKDLRILEASNEMKPLLKI